MLNAATLAAILVAVWAHPSGVEYLEKIERIAACEKANPCCVKPGSGGPDKNTYGGGGARQYTDDLSPDHLRELGWPPAPGPVPEFLVAKPPVTQPVTPPQQAPAPESVIGSLHASETLYSQASDVELQAEVRRQADEEALILILAQLL